MAVYFNQKPIINNGLILLLDAPTPKSYPGNGTSWYDLSNNNNNMVISGPIFSSEKSGTLFFDGINDYGEINTSFNVTSIPMTISLWLSRKSRTSGGIGDNRCHVILGDGTNHILIGNQYSGSTTMVRHTKFMLQGYGFSTIYTLTPDLYYNIVFSADPINNSFSFYINGVKQTINAGYYADYFTYTTINLPKLHLGYYYFQNPSFQYESQSVGQLAIYNRILSDEEVNYNYLINAGRYI